MTGEWRYERMDDVGHWLQLEAPDRVNELLLGFPFPPDRRIVNAAGVKGNGGRDLGAPTSSAAGLSGAERLAG